MLNNLELHSQTENDEIPGAGYPNENDSGEGETNKLSALPNFMPQILPDDEVVKGTNSLNLKQRQVFNVVHTWVKDYVKFDGHSVETIHIFLSGSGGTSKSYLVKTLSSTISKTSLFHCKSPRKTKSSFNWSYRNISYDELWTLNDELCINWYMDRYWFKFGRNIYDDSWKTILWFFSYRCSKLALTTSSQRKIYIFKIFW